MGGFLSLMTDKGEFKLLGNPGGVQVHKSDLSMMRLISSADRAKTMRAASFTGALVVSREGEEITPEALEDLIAGDHLAIRVDGGGGESWDLGTIRDIP